MQEELTHALEAYGAVPSQLVDPSRSDDARALRYVDLLRTSSPSGVPVVVESQAQPRLYVFKSGQTDKPTEVKTWVRRVAFRGDADWVGVMRPGRLDVYRAVLDGASEPVAIDLPQGPELLPQLLYKPPEGRGIHVRAKLLELLGRSIQQAKALDIDPEDALSLIGRALFWRFLIDRGLLDGLRVEDICEGATNWPECLSTKKNALQTFTWLDDTFNGGLLPFKSAPSTFAEKAFVKVLGDIAHGADATGQLSLRLPKDWCEVNFAHVPVGLLSEVYEAFAHDEDPARAKSESIFYTPRHIAEFVVQDALEPLADVERPRVLDPAAGAGVFLVAMFRALAAREWARDGVRPSRSVIRRILNTQLTGFDINDSALRLAELSLYLTAIELDPDPKPRPLKLLQFKSLRQHALFKMPGGADSGSLEAVQPEFYRKFDVVLGNPPWTPNKSMTTKSVWVEASRRVVEERLGEDRARTFDLAQKNPDLVFVYRAMEWAKPGRSIALVTHARWLFGQSPTAIRARNDLLESVHVTGVLNGAALRDTNVWPNVRHPFAILFAANEKPPPGAGFLLVNPELDQVPDRNQQRMRLDWQDAREVLTEEAIAKPRTLKIRFRGGPFDEAAIRSIQQQGVRLDEYLESIGTRLRNGYKVGGKKGSQRSAAHLYRLPDLSGQHPEFFIDASGLPRFIMRTLHFPRPRENYKAPLLIVTESMHVDDLRARASLSREDVIYDERFDGVSFAAVVNGLDIAEYLQLVLQSSLCRYLYLLLDEQFGVEREVVHKTTIESVPVVPWSSLSNAQRKRSKSLSLELRNGLTPARIEKVNDFMFDVFSLSNVERDAIRDTLSTVSPTADEKKNALRATTDAERRCFAVTCEQAIQDVLTASGASAAVRVRDDLTFGSWRILQVDKYQGMRPTRRELDLKRFLEAADEAAASLVIVHDSADIAIVGILDRYRYWTPTRARVLAATMLSEVDNHG